MATARQQLLLLPPLPLPLCFVCNVQQQQQQATGNNVLQFSLEKTS